MPPKENKTTEVGAGSNPPAKKTEVDLEKILLPKKETPGGTVQSAQRINAGALLDQEQRAELPKTDSQSESGTKDSKQIFAEETTVKPLQTFQGDIEKVVQQKNVSTVSIAAAEAQRRAGQPLNQTEAPKMNTAQMLKIGMWVIGAVLLVAAIALIASLIIKPSSETRSQASEALYIFVDESTSIALTQNNLTREALMRELISARDTFGISLGLFARVAIGTASTSGQVNELRTEDFLTFLSPQIPSELMRTLNPRFLLGLHSYNGNQPFLILKSDSYESAYSGFLAWEHTMHNDLLPLFDRKAPIRQPIQAGAPSGVGDNSARTVFLQTEFIDRIVENHDTRVIQNEFKDILLLWTFLDRKTILIATNEATVREVIRRLKDAPIISLP